MNQTGALTLAKVIGDLNSRWQPHATQQAPLSALFLHLFSLVFLECGRKWGKSEIIAYFLWRRALTGAMKNYYFSPEQKQTKEIFWASRRIIDFGPQPYIEDVNNTEMRIKFKNGAYIKCDGSDNFNAYRGIEPDTCVYDEYRDFRPEFHQVMGPNLLPRKAPLLVATTPPEMDLVHYEAMKAGLVLGHDLFNFPSWANPYNDRGWLKKERAKLYARGEGDVWEREYSARRVRGGSNSIFPMYSSKLVRPHKEIMDSLLKDKKKLIWQVICDPGNATCFAVLFRAINPFTRVVYRLAEIYETNQAETSTSRIVPRIQAMREELVPSWEAHGIDWDQLYDEAATWFSTEALNSFGESFTPTAKGTRDIDEGLSLLKDQMLYDLTIISDRCTNLSKEIENFIRDPKTGRPRKDCQDHLIDCDRYGNDFAGIDLAPEKEPDSQDPDDARRFRTPDQDLEDEMQDDDEAFGVLDDF